MGRLALILSLAVAACGGPDKPFAANAPKPDPAAVAGVAAAAAAAITLASPDATRKPESSRDVEKKPITVKENVPSDVLDRLDKEPASTGSDTPQRQPGDSKEPPAPIDYSQLRGPPLKKP